MLNHGHGRTEQDVADHTSENQGGEEQRTAQPGEPGHSAYHQARGAVIDLAQDAGVTDQWRQECHRDRWDDVACRDARGQLGPSDLYLEDGEDNHRYEQRPQILQPALGEQSAGNEPPQFAGVKIIALVLEQACRLLLDWTGRVYQGRQDEAGHGQGETRGNGPDQAAAADGAPQRLEMRPAHGDQHVHDSVADCRR